MLNLFKSNRGFTLIELLVVILIIAILIAVAAPSFLGQQDKARDSATKQSLTVSRKEVKAAYVSAEDQKLPSQTALVADLNSGEPQYSFVGVPSPATTTNISVKRESDTSVSLCQQSESGVFYCMLTNELGNLASLTDNNVAYAADSSVRKSNGTTEPAARAALGDPLNPSTPVPANTATAKSGWEAPVKVTASSGNNGGTSNVEAANLAAKQKAVTAISGVVSYINSQNSLPQATEASAATVIAASGVPMINGFGNNTNAFFDFANQQVGTGGIAYFGGYTPCQSQAQFVIYSDSIGGDKFYFARATDIIGEGATVDLFEFAKKGDGTIITSVQAPDNAVQVTAVLPALDTKISACS